MGVVRVELLRGFAPAYLVEDKNLTANVAIEKIGPTLTLYTDVYVYNSSQTETGELYYTGYGPPSFEMLGVPSGAVVTAIAPVDVSGSVEQWYWFPFGPGTGSHSLEVGLFEEPNPATLLAPIAPTQLLPAAVTSFSLSLSPPTTGLSLPSNTLFRPKLFYNVTSSGVSHFLSTIVFMARIILDIHFEEPQPPQPAPPQVGNPFVPNPGGGVEDGTDDELPPYDPEVQDPVEDSHCWEFDSRLFYYDAPLARTFCFDPEAGALGGEWSDTGWNTVYSTAVVRAAGIEETLLLTGSAARVWRPHDSAYGKPYPFDPVSAEAALFGAGAFMTNRQMPALASRPNPVTALFHWPKIVRFRPMDGEGTMMRQRLKRLIRVTVWGEQEPRDAPERVGWLAVRSDRGRVEKYPIITRRLPSGHSDMFGTVPERTMLTQQEFTPNMVGRVFVPTVEFQQDHVTIRDILMEYIILD